MKINKVKDISHYFQSNLKFFLTKKSKILNVSIVLFHFAHLKEISLLMKTYMILGEKKLLDFLQKGGS